MDTLRRKCLVKNKLMTNLGRFLSALFEGNLDVARGGSRFGKAVRWFVVKLSLSVSLCWSLLLKHGSAKWIFRSIFVCISFDGTHHG